MAVVEKGGQIIRGRVGDLVFQYRWGTNYARRYVIPANPRTEAQSGHRKRFAEMQRVASLWNREFITPYFQGDRQKENPRNKFIKYNWAEWDKESPVWQSAVPFWGIKRKLPWATVFCPGERPDEIPVKVIGCIPEDLTGSDIRFYGFYIQGNAETFIQFPLQKVSSSGIQLFDTGLNAYSSEETIHYIPWLETAEERTPLTMPVNQRVYSEPDFPGWLFHSCAVSIEVEGKSLLVSFISDIPASSIGETIKGYARLWDEGGGLLETISAEPIEGIVNEEVTVRAEYPLSEVPGSLLRLQCWFEDTRHHIPVSEICLVEYRW
jgi:hypothetical protein